MWRRVLMRRWLLLLALAAVPVFVPLAEGQPEPRAKLIKTIPVPDLNGIPQEPLRIYDGNPGPPHGRADDPVTLTLTVPASETP
jgi:hypothetical protein